MALAGCDGGGDAAKRDTERPSPAKWRGAVEDRIGHPFHNDAAWQSYRDSWAETCQSNSSADEWAMYVAVSVDGGAAASAVEQDVRYACPESLPEVQDAIMQVQDNAREMDEACSLPRNLRSEEQQQVVEAVGC